MIWHIVQRARACQKVDRIVVATSTDTSDDPLASYCAEAGIEYYRGSLLNVLSRYLDVLNVFPHPYFVRITGDCPLIDPSFIDRQVDALEAHDGDHIWLDASVPVLVGQGVHSTKSLRKISALSDHPDDLEHVGARFLSEHPELFRIIGLQPPKGLRDLAWRVTVDEAEDYGLMQELYAALWRGAPIPLDEALEWMSENPTLAAGNQAVSGSPINCELVAKREAWRCHVAVFSDWNEPRSALADDEGA